jgi:hypothetical protein
VRAGRERETQCFGGGIGRGAGERPANRTFVPTESEAVEVLATRRKPGNFGAQGVREVRPRPGCALLRDAREARILCNFPGDLEDRLAQIRDVERLRREPRPDDEAVG